MPPIIQVNDLCKSYTISHEGRETYTALRDVMAQKAKRFFSFPRWNSKTIVTKEDFWALKDISFKIEQGERVGIIGRNGAGKSTLLKILSRITEPTSGTIKIRGRVASLLEVGTGFHPELTGRENIYLNGAILGMSRAEIKKHFDAIVDFAEIEIFLDTPVKRYSSGMYVRLAFAVAAHLEPEILIIDEVLAVGDAQFQKKCLGKMEDVSKNEGRTVLFVSHNMLAIKSLCSSGLLMEKGRLENSGAIESIIDQYMSADNQRINSFVSIEKSYNGFCIHSVKVSDNGINGVFNIEEDLVFEIKVSGEKDYQAININLFFNTTDGITVFAACSPAEHFAKGDYTFTCVIPANTLNDNDYIIDLMVVENGPKILHHLKEIIFIEGVEEKREGAWLGKFPGLMRPNFKWKKNRS